MTTLDLMSENGEKFYKRLEIAVGKEKLFIMSNFSFSQSVLKRLVLQTCKNKGLFGKELKGENDGNLVSASHHVFYHTIPTFIDPEREGSCKHCGKRRKCRFSQCFLPYQGQNCSFESPLSSANASNLA